MSYLGMSKFAKVNAVIASIESSTDWDIAENSDQQYFYQLRGAQNVGIFEPFTDDQKSLIDYLNHRKAGLQLCDYAFRVFAQAN